MEAINLLTTGETADLLRLTTHRVKRLAKTGEIPVIRLPGDEFRFDERELWKWIEAHKDSGGEVTSR